MQRSSFLTASLWGFATAGIVRPMNVQAQPEITLRVAATPNDTYAPAYFAQDMGFFSKAGLAVDLQTMTNGAAIMTAVVGGSIDIGISTPIAIANAYVHDFPVVIVAAGCVNLPNVHAMVVCVSRASPIKTAKDLEGKTVALTTLKTGSQVSLDAWLLSGGADLSKVRAIETPFTEMGAALDRGTVSAAVLSEPALSLALKQNDIRVLVDPNLAIAKRFITTCWFSTRQFAAQNGNTILRFQQAIYASQKWANTHQYDSAAILSKYSKMDVDVVRSGVRAPFAEELRISEIQPYLDAAAKDGIVSRDVAAADIVYHQ